MLRRSTRLAALLPVALFLLVPSLCALPLAAQNPHQTLLGLADALVTVKFVLEVKTGAGEQEFEGEISCPRIDAAGLVLCSNTELGGYVAVMSRVMGSAHGLGVSAVPTGLEVLAAAGGEGLPARLLARDTDRDLAWIQIDKPPAGQAPAFLDLSHSAEAQVGEPVYYLRRLHPFFGAEPIVTAARIGAVVKVPLPLIVPARPASPGFGVPAFTAEGRLLGLTVLQLPGLEDGGARLLQSPMAMLGAAVGIQDMVGGLILPAAEIVRATELARETFAEDE